MNFPQSVNILGTEYQIIVKKYDEDEAFARSKIDGYCDSWAKQIVICALQTYPGWENELEKTIEAANKETLRHEIVHAFFSESGLDANSNSVEGPWPKNEEMVDWLALQGEKIHKAWREAGALSQQEA